MQVSSAMRAIRGNACSKCNQSYKRSIEMITYWDDGEQINSCYGREECGCGVQHYRLDNGMLWLWPERCPCCKRVEWSWHRPSYYSYDSFMGFFMLSYCSNCGDYAILYSEEGDYMYAMPVEWVNDHRFSFDLIPF